MTPSEMRCRICGALKAPALMRQRLGQPQKLCKACDTVLSRRYYQTHREACRATNKQYRERPDRKAADQLREQRRKADPNYRASERVRHRADRQRDEVRARNREYQRQYAASQKAAVRAHT